MRTLAILALCLAPLAAQDRGRNKPKPDVADEKYGEHERNVFDLWLAKSEKPTPLVIFIHGGGFRGGSKERFDARLLAECLKAGISFASFNYRLSGTASFPAPMHDCARALQTLRHNAKKWNLDPEKIACTGGSAGAGISLWLAFHDDLADPDSEDPVERQSTRITTAFVTNGQTSYDPRFIKEHVGGRAHEHSALQPFWGLKDEEMDSEKAVKIWEECSPIHHLTKDDPSVWLGYSGRDKPGEKPGKGIHSEKFGYVLQKKMKELKLECTVKVGREFRGARDQIEFVRKQFGLSDDD